MKYDYVVNIFSGAIDRYPYKKSSSYITKDYEILVYHTLSDAWNALSWKQHQSWGSLSALRKYLRHN